jgi:AcrR family transcriptional regulator
MQDSTQKDADCEKMKRGRPVSITREARCDAIFDALEAVHAKAGLDGATMQAIAMRAGMSKRTLYAIFPSRIALLRSYLDRVTDQFITPLTAAETDLPIAERLVLCLSRNSRHQGYGLPLEILRAFVARVPSSPEIGRDLVQGVMQRELAILASELQRGIARGEIGPEEDAESAAALLLDMVRPWPIESLLDPARLAPPDTIAARRRLAIRVFLHGMNRPSGHP